MTPPPTTTATSSSSSPYPRPQGDLPLPLTFLPRPSRRALIIGHDKLAAARAFTFLDSSFGVVVLPSSTSGPACDELRYRESVGEVEFHPGFIGTDETDPREWARLISSIGRVDMVVVTDTILTPTTPLPRSYASARAIFLACTSDDLDSGAGAGAGAGAACALRLPVNTTDHPDLSTFSFPSIARFPSSHPGRRSNLQIAVSTNGKGCRLAGRIRREVVSRLPRGVGAAVDNVGELRTRVRARSPVGVGAGGSGRSGSCTRGGNKKQQLGPAHNTGRQQRQQTSTPTPTSTPPNLASRTHTRSTSHYLHTDADDDETSTFLRSGPLNSPVPQLDSPALSRTSSSRSLVGMGAGAGAQGLGQRMQRRHAEGARDVTGDGYPFPTVVGPTTADADAQTQTLIPLPLSPAMTHRPGPSSTSSSASSSSAAGDAAGMDEEDHQLRRMRWVSQISEYWSIEYLARMGEEEMERCLEMWGTEGNGGGEADIGEISRGEAGAGGPDARGRSTTTAAAGDVGEGTTPTGGSDSQLTPRHGLALDAPPRAPMARRGKILLLGSGPGHPSLLTVAAHQALLTATLILSDKLVPAEILALIPRSTTLHIAKKFPGNAEGAQNEMMQLALEGALRGETVVRLKQGDPFVYGRGGEEVLFFREHGFESVVVPGISSSIAGPLMMGIPVTQRGVADSMVLCTGVGRKGKAVQLPGYVRGRTLIVLMGVARIHQVLQVLTHTDLEGDPEARETTGWRDGDAFPPHLPIAIIERASSHDQRMVASTLDKIESALERSGEQRPPGMMIIGWAALALEGQGEVTVLDDDEDTPDLEARDKARVERWLGGQDYILKDGLGEEWAQFLPPGAAATVTEVE